MMSTCDSPSKRRQVHLNVPRQRVITPTAPPVPIELIEARLAPPAAPYLPPHYRSWQFAENRSRVCARRLLPGSGMLRFGSNATVRKPKACARTLVIAATCAPTSTAHAAKNRRADIALSISISLRVHLDHLGPDVVVFKREMQTNRSALPAELDGRAFGAARWFRLSRNSQGIPPRGAAQRMSI